MKTMTIRIMKRQREGEMIEKTIDISDLTEILTPQEVFMMEMKLNELPYLRFHIEMKEEEVKDEKSETANN